MRVMLSHILGTIVAENGKVNKRQITIRVKATACMGKLYQ